ncbi:uncharacterized protein C13orf42 homolog [Bufo bufo]|uniref:uncharacterized protein C13orf42 homolog n=1 Tax=Bufo bufo TaxID=8384 RepID=UPI001ABECC57|nr:uncharacterized protein C13orf42 homolog [Bufo bufo]
MLRKIQSALHPNSCSRDLTEGSTTHNGSLSPVRLVRSTSMYVVGEGKQTLAESLKKYKSTTNIEMSGCCYYKDEDSAWLFAKTQDFLQYLQDLLALRKKYLASIHNLRCMTGTSDYLPISTKAEKRSSQETRDVKMGSSSKKMQHVIRLEKSNIGLKNMTNLQNVQKSRAKLDRIAECVPPMALTYRTAEMLSIRSLMQILDKPLAKLRTAKEPTRSSKALMWNLDSSGDQGPPVITPSQYAPQPRRLASESTVKSGWGPIMAFPFQVSKDNEKQNPNSDIMDAIAYFDSVIAELDTERRIRTAPSNFKHADVDFDVATSSREHSLHSNWILRAPRRSTEEVLRTSIYSQSWRSSMGNTSIKRIERYPIYLPKAVEGAFNTLKFNPRTKVK